MIVTACARLQTKKTSICFLTDIKKMEEIKKQAAKKANFTWKRRLHLETSECPPFQSAALDFSSDKDVIFWKWSLLSFFWLKGFDVWLSLCCCLCSDVHACSSGSRASRKQLEVCNPDPINTAVDIGVSKRNGDSLSVCRNQWNVEHREHNGRIRISTSFLSWRSSCQCSDDSISLSFPFDSIYQSVLRTKLERKGALRLNPLSMFRHQFC